MSGRSGELTDIAVGMRVREARARLQLTQAALAQRLSVEGLNLHSSAVAKIESGERSLRLIEGPAMSTALGVSLAWLVGLADEAPPSAVDARAERALRRILRTAQLALPEGRLAELERTHASLVKLAASGVKNSGVAVESLKTVRREIDALKRELQNGA